MSYYCNCPRCGGRTLERLKTYSFCANCNYSDVLDEPYSVPYHVQLLAEEKRKDIEERKNNVISLDDKRKKKNKKIKEAVN